MPGSHSSSEEDDDVVVFRTCGNRCCQRTDDLKMDEDTSTMYCARCRELFARAEKEGFRLLLTDEDRPLVKLIFDKLDEAKKGYWDYLDWVKFQSMTDHRSEEAIDSDEALHNFFTEEFDIALTKNKAGEYVASLVDIENMYGGFFYNQVDALSEDAAAMEDAGVINTEVLE